MSETLTAAAIYGCYAPAWEAAPESRPNGWTPARFPGESEFSHWIKWGERRDDEDAANACRCAAEDWLIAQQHDAVVTHSKDMKWAVGRPIDSKWASYRFSDLGHPTIHHALAAAVIAVAKAKA